MRFPSFAFGDRIRLQKRLGFQSSQSRFSAPVGPTIALVARNRWLVRIALAGYAATSIAAWAVAPTLYSTAYLAKAIELSLVTVLAIDFVRHDGNPIERVRHELRSLLARPHGPASGGA